SVLLPLIPKYLEFTANGLYGRGVGRYGAGQLPDVTIAADGSLSLVTGWSAMVGLIGHPWEGLDVYVYAGQEEVAANFFNIGTPSAMPLAWWRRRSHFPAARPPTASPTTSGYPK